MSDALPGETAATYEPLKGGIVPYLMLQNAAGAIDFYKTAFGAEEVGPRNRMEDGRIMNARVDMNGASVMLMDPMPEHGHPAVAPQAFNLHLHVASADATFDRAVQAKRQVGSLFKPFVYTAPAPKPTTSPPVPGAPATP